MKLIIAGSRSFSDYNSLSSVCDNLIQNAPPGTIQIVSGGSAGADQLAEKYAKQRNIPLIKFLPDWEQFGRAAGPIRNIEMARYATHCIAFWDGKSRGTASMIKQAKKHGLITKVVPF